MALIPLLSKFQVLWSYCICQCSVSRCQMLTKANCYFGAVMRTHRKRGPVFTWHVQLWQEQNAHVFWYESPSQTTCKQPFSLFSTSEYDDIFTSDFILAVWGLTDVHSVLFRWLEGAGTIWTVSWMDRVILTAPCTYSRFDTVHPDWHPFPYIVHCIWQSWSLYKE
jgi:hypothetical protein